MIKFEGFGLHNLHNAYVTICVINIACGLSRDRLTVPFCIFSEIAATLTQNPKALLLPFFTSPYNI